MKDHRYNSSENNFTESDIAFLIPTKDRPEKIKDLLNSLASQTVSCGRVIVVDGGKSIKNIVMSFSDRLPIEYYECHPPGQIRQRNMGISLCDERTPLIGFLDDDLVLEPEALEAMVAFWNTCEPDTAGVSFNIVNTPVNRASWIKSFLGLSSSLPGRVLRSGMTTSYCPATGSIRTQWVCGGATVWRQEIFRQFRHKEVNTRWAIGEDIIFSYPIGKTFPLYVCAEARARHEHVYDYTSNMKHRYHGRTQTLWLFYFVESNEDLSRLLFLWTLLIRITGKLTIGLLKFKVDHLEFAFGQMEGVIKGLKAFIGKKNIITILSEEYMDTSKNRVS